MLNKKISSFVLAIVFTFVTVLGCFSAMSVSASTILLHDEDYQKASQVLKLICPDFPLSEGEVTTRAEFVAAVTMAMNMPSSQSAETSFIDVPANHKYAKNIAYALGLGLISNVDLFYPDSPVTYSQAIKIVMCAAGFAPKAEYQGGYPVGYLKAAHDAEVGKGIELSDTDSVSHEAAIKIIFDAIVTDMMDVTSFGSNVDYTVTEGKNILSAYHKIFMAEGIVEANEHTGLTNNEAVSSENTIIVNGVSYFGAGYENFIGKNVRIFFGDDKKNTILYAYECDNTVYDYTEKDSLAISGLNLTVSPEDGEKDIRYSLEADYSFMYNGKFYGAADYNSYINPTSGVVQLVDNDDNGKIDVVFVKNIEYGVVASVNEFDEKIYDKYKVNGLVDLSDSDVKYFLTQDDGAEIALDDFEENDAVGYVISKDKKLYEIIRFTKRVGGTFSEKTSDGYITINGVSYALSEYYTKNVKSLDKLKFGTDVILHLGIADRVIYVQEFASSISYGFVVAAGLEKGMSGRAAVKLYSDKGEMLELQAADKVKFGSESLSSQESIARRFEEIEASPYAYRVVKYSLNAEGKISKVFPSVDNTEGTNVIYRQTVEESSPVIYYDSTKLTDGGVISDDPLVSIPYEIADNACPFYCRGAYTPYFHSGTGCITMQVPVRPGGFSDEDNFRIGGVTEEEYQRAVAYDVGEGGGAKFILITKDSTGGGSIGKYTGSAIIESITRGVNEDGEETTILKLYYGGNWAKYYYEAETTKISKEGNGGNGTVSQTELTIDDFAPGDIIRMSATSENVLTEMTMNFDASAKAVDSSLTKSGSNGGRYVEYIPGYALSLSSAKQSIIAIDSTIEDIVEAQGKVDIAKTFSGTFTRGTTVFVRINRDRTTGKVRDAVVYTEPNLNSVETYFNSGSQADYIVFRQYFREPSLNVIYVNIDE